MTDINLFDYVNPYIYYRSKFIETNQDIIKQNKSVEINNITLKLDDDEDKTLSINYSPDNKKHDLYLTDNTSGSGEDMYYMSFGRNDIYNYLFYNKDFSIDENNIKLKLNDGDELCFYNLFNSNTFCINNLLINTNEVGIIEGLLKQNK